MKEPTPSTNKTLGQTKQAGAPKLTPQERRIIRWVERDMGRPLSRQEVNLALKQARELGESR
jgi:hypothetical protein